MTPSSQTLNIKYKDKVAADEVGNGEEKKKRQRKKKQHWRGAEVSTSNFIKKNHLQLVIDPSES